MPYNPLAPTESTRSRVYQNAWIGGAGTIVTLANVFIGMDNLLTAVAIGAMAGGLLSSVFVKATDSYYQSLCATGHRWMACAIGHYLVIRFILESADLAHGAGYLLANGKTQASGIGPGFTALVDAWFVLVCACLAFYAGYAFAWFRDRDWGRSEEDA